MTEYPRPWRIAYHLAWFVVDANDGIVAGPFDSSGQAYEYVKRNFSEKWLNPEEK